MQTLLKLVDTENTDNAIIGIEAARSLLKCIYSPMLDAPDHQVTIGAEALGLALAGIESILGHASNSLYR